MNVRGRPKKKEPCKDKDFHIRMSQEELDMVDEICFEKEKTRAAVVREALKMYYKTYLYLD